MITSNKYLDFLKLILIGRNQGFFTYKNIHTFLSHTLLFDI